MILPFLCQRTINMPARESPPETITIDYKGRTLEGTYRVLREKGGRIQTLTVSTLMLGTKSAGVGRMPYEALARMLLREFVEDANARRHRSLASLQSAASGL